MEAVTMQKVADVIARELGIDPSEVRPETPLRSMVTDSLEMANLILEFEGEFRCEIPDEVAQKFMTVRHAVEYLELAGRP